jgi:hypothetical protein
MIASDCNGGHKSLDCDSEVDLSSPVIKAHVMPPTQVML